MLTDKHADDRLGRTITVPWHFDTPEFYHAGERWLIASARIGIDPSLDSTIYTIRRHSGGDYYEYTHKQLVKKLRVVK